MKFREFNKALKEKKMLKPTSPKMRLQMAIAIALDMGGNMTGAYKKIEKIQKGLGDHPAVAAALRFANESVNEKLSKADKKKRLLMIKKAVEKMKERELKMAKKDAMAAINDLEFESVDEGKYTEYSDLLVMKARIIDKEGPKSNKLPAVDDAIRIAKKKLGIKEDIKEDGIMSYPKKNEKKIRPMLMKIAKKHPKVKVSFGTTSKGKFVDDNNINFKGKDKDVDALLKDIQNNHKNLVKMMEATKIDGRRKEFKEKIKKLAYEKMKKMMKNQKEQWEITEGKVERKEKELNLKLKELEYKMKLKDFMKDVVDSKLPKGKKEEEEPKKPDAKKEPEGMAELKIDDTSSTNYNALLKIAKDIGVEISREKDHLLVQGDAKKMEDFKMQMAAVKEYHSVKKFHASIESHHALKEEFQDLIEGYSRRINDKDVDKEFADYLKASPPGMEDLEDFYGDVDKAREEMKQDFHPGNSARPNAWTALRYPVRDGDYYFAFISKNNKKNMKYNEALNDFLLDIKRNGVDALSPAKSINVDELWTMASRYITGKGYLGYERGNPKMKERKHIGKFPSDLGAGDTMTREEVWMSINHLLGKIRESNIKERFNKKMTQAGIMVGKRRGAPKYKLESKMKLSTLQNKLKEARYGKSMNRKDIMRKHGNEMKKALRTGNLELSDKAEGDLIQYIMDNHPEEIRTDDPDEWIQWLDDNLEDFVRGRGY